MIRPLWGILPRYLFRQLAVPLLLGMGMFTVMLLLPPVLDALEWARLGGISFATVLRFLVCFVPRLTLMTLPMALLLASLFVYGRMTEEREIDAMLTSGVSYWRILYPALALAALCAMFLVFWAHLVAPRAVEIQRHLIEVMTDELRFPILSEGQFNPVGDAALFVEKFDPETGELGNVVYFGLAGGGWTGREQVVDYFLCAPRGRAALYGASRELVLELDGGTAHQLARADGTYTQAHLGSVGFHLDVRQRLRRLLEAATAREEGMPTGDLFAQAEEYFSRVEHNRNYRARGQRYLIEFHRRFAIPAAALVLALIGAPLGILTGLGRKTISFAVALLVLLLYYISMSTWSNLAESGIVSAALGVWATPAIFLVFGLGLNARMGRR